jgi:carbon monoxide dehydrogenase subunit G
VPAERTVRSTAVVAAPIEAMWELVSDPARAPDWAANTVESRRADRPLRLGSTYEERNVVLGPLRGSTRWTVIEHDPPRRTVHRGEGIAITAGMTREIALRSVDGATEVTLAFRYRPALGALGGLLDRAVFHRSLRAALNDSARNLEALAARELAGR